MRVLRWVAAAVAVASLAGCGQPGYGAAGKLSPGGVSGGKAAAEGRTAAQAGRVLTKVVASLTEAGTGAVYASGNVRGNSWQSRAIVDVTFDLGRDRYSMSMVSKSSGRGIKLPEDVRMTVVGIKDRTYVRPIDAAKGVPWVGFRARAADDGTAENAALLDVLRMAVATDVWVSPTGTRTLYATVPLMAAVSLVDPDGLLATTHPGLRFGAERVKIVVIVDQTGSPTRLNIEPFEIRPYAADGRVRAAVATGEFYSRFEDLGAGIAVRTPADVRMLSDEEYAASVSDLSPASRT